MYKSQVEERTIDNEEKSIYANRKTEIQVNMDYIRKLGLAEGEDLGDCLLYTSRCV